MAAIVVYDPSDSDVANRVTSYVPSAHTPDYDAETNKLVNPDLSSLSAVPIKHWKYDGTSAIVEMSQAEKDAVAITTTTFGESTGLLDGEISITQDTTWQNLGGRVTNIQSIMSLVFGHTDMSRSQGRVPFRIKTDGSGTEIRIVQIAEDTTAENDGTLTVLVSAAHAAGDTGGIWKCQSFTTDVTPVAGDAMLRLQGRLNGATSAVIGEAAMTLLDVVTV